MVFLPVALATLTLALASCTINVNMPGAGPGMPGGGSSQTLSGYSSEELMFARMMIPHHQQAIDMAEMAREISDSPAIVDLALQIRDGQEPEIIQMEQWLVDSGQSVGSGDMGHDGSMGGHQGGHMMDGMVSEEDLASLAQLSSPEFDRMFLELMIEHHEGALDMVQMIIRSSNPDVKQLADDIVRAQRAEIGEMRTLLGGL